MELKTCTLVAVIYSFTMLIQTLALPMSQDNDMQNQLLSADKRPKYMETRDLPFFKDMILLALGELVDEGKINPIVFEGQAEVPVTDSAPALKRGARLSFCTRVSPSGSLYSKPCWKKFA